MLEKGEGGVEKGRGNGDEGRGWPGCRSRMPSVRHCPVTSPTSGGSGDTTNSVLMEAASGAEEGARGEATTSPGAADVGGTNDPEPPPDPAHSSALPQGR
jgi:hypothetical protein